MFSSGVYMKKVLLVFILSIVSTTVFADMDGRTISLKPVSRVILRNFSPKFELYLDDQTSGYWDIEFSFNENGSGARIYSSGTQKGFIWSPLNLDEFINSFDELIFPDIEIAIEHIDEGYRMVQNDDKTYYLLLSDASDYAIIVYDELFNITIVTYKIKGID
jgi:hypothetical protein